MHDLIPLFTTCRGTASRGEFWRAGGLLFVGGFILSLAPLLGNVVPLLLLYPWTCLAMGRLRDMGRPPSFALAPAALCGVAALLGLGTAISAANPAQWGTALFLGGITVLIATLALLVACAFLLWIGLTPGLTERAAATGLQR